MSHRALRVVMNNVDIQKIPEQRRKGKKSRRKTRKEWRGGVSIQDDGRKRETMR